jgi:hypothetical protein
MRDGRPVIGLHFDQPGNENDTRVSRMSSIAIAEELCHGNDCIQPMRVRKPITTEGKRHPIKPKGQKLEIERMRNER